MQLCVIGGRGGFNSLFNSLSFVNIGEFLSLLFSHACISWILVFIHRANLHLDEIKLSYRSNVNPAFLLILNVLIIWLACLSNPRIWLWNLLPLCKIRKSRDPTPYIYEKNHLVFAHRPQQLQFMVILADFHCIFTLSYAVSNIGLKLWTNVTVQLSKRSTTCFYA